MIINKLFEEAGWRFFDNEVGPGSVGLDLSEGFVATRTMAESHCGT